MANLTSLDPRTFEVQSYSPQDEGLLGPYIVGSSLQSSSFVDLYVYDVNKQLIATNFNFQGYSIEESSPTNEENNLIQLSLNPIADLGTVGLNSSGKYITYYSFLNNEVGDNNDILYISEISTDRTELRLKSSFLPNDQLVEIIEDFIDKREESEYFLDFYLNFGNNNLIISNNIKLSNEESLDPSVLVKLYEPLPSSLGIKDKLNIVTEVSEPLAYEIFIEPEVVVKKTYDFLKGPNFTIPIKNEVNNSSLNLSYNDIISSASTGSQNQIDSLLSQSAINISVDYNNFSDFINFSSAQTRIENFYYKVGLIENYNSEINALNNITGSTTSKQIINSKISNVTKNFDQFEYFMYYSSGSMVSYPKSTTTQPYTLYPTTSSQVLTWLGSVNENSGNFGGLLLSASNYDNENPDQLKKSIPEYLREDPANQQYDLFVDMVAQYYDNVWLYTKDITQKYNADNRLDFGVSKDLVADAIRDFGVKLYQNNFSNQELYTAFLGMTPSGSLFPFPEITGSMPVPTGMEFVDTLISASNDVISMDDTNKSLYKRLYHNIPYLLKSKGTIAGLRALITSYGIPDTILKISEFGGKDQVNANDYDLYQNNFNYSFNPNRNNFLSTDWGKNRLNSNWVGIPDLTGGKIPSVNTLQFRFKAQPITSGTSPYGLVDINQDLWGLPNSLGNAAITLEYPGSGLSSGSYDGSIPSSSYQYANLKFYPDQLGDSTEFAQVTLPFFDNGWWSVQLTRLDRSDWELSAGNKIYNGNDGTSIGYYGEDRVSAGTPNHQTIWNESTLSLFARPRNFSGFSGSLQEIRYYTTQISQSVFKDYIMNPLSFEGNGVNSAPDQLIFRAALGSELDITTTSSIHPKVTGSWATTSSFISDSNFSFPSTPTYLKNTEYFFLDQPAVGIKNRITDKIRSENSTIPGNTLSPIKSLSQTVEASASYTPNINYLEVAFSPQNQINDDIIAQMGHFNIGDYIGDPRQRSSNAVIYPDLNNLSEEYFKKYIKQYDLVDFVRLIKFFDNSLFKMIKDFIPARTSLASGLVVKQHLLERNKYPQPQVSYSDESELSGSIDIAEIEGGAGGMFNPFNINYEGSSTVISGSNTFSYSWRTLAFDASSETPIGTTGRITVYQSGFITNTNILKFLDFRDTTGENNPNLWLKYQSSPAVYPLFYFNTINNYVSVARVQNIEDLGGGSYLISLATGYGFASSIPQGNSEDKNGGFLSFVSSSLGTGNVFSETIPFTSSITNYTFETQPQFNVTQSWEVTEPTLSGSITYIHDSQDEFYNGELSGSTLIVSNGELNEEDAEYKTINPRGATYGIRFYDTGSGYNFNDFINPLNNPYNGFIQMWYQENQSAADIPAANPGGNTNI